MTSIWVVKKPKKDGSSSWVVYARDGGRGAKVKTLARVTSEREANRLKRAAQLAAQEARAGVFEIRPTIGEVLDAYEKHLEGRASAVNAERVNRLHLRPALGDVELVKLEREDVQALADRKVRDDGLSPQMVRHIIGTLRAAWRRAKRTKPYAKLLEGRACPAEEIEMPRVRARAKQTFSLPELTAAIEELETPWREAAGAAAWLLMRPGELFALRREDVDMDARIVTVRRSWDREQPKDGDERIVPIFRWAEPYLERALRRAEGIGGPLVFPDVDGTMMPRTNETKIARRLRAAMVRAAAKGRAPSLVTSWTLKCRRRHDSGVHCHYETVVDRLPASGPPRCPRCGFKLWPVGQARPVRWYDLRHTGATLLIELGVKPHVVSSMLGHHDLELTMRTYVNLSAAGMLAELDRVARAHPSSGASPVLPKQTKAGA